MCTSGAPSHPHVSSKATERPAASGMPSLVAASRPLCTSGRCAVNSAAGSRPSSRVAGCKPPPRACFRRLSSRVGPGLKARSDRVELRQPVEGPTCRETQRESLTYHSAWSQVQWSCTFDQRPNLQRSQGCRIIQSSTLQLE